jgi:hypothetical protein
MGYGEAPPALEMAAPLVAWAYRFKTDPSTVGHRSSVDAWMGARRLLLHAIPAALAHAGLPSLDDYARHDSLLDRATYAWRARRVPEARRWVLDPTGRVRVGTLRLLQATEDMQVDPDVAARCFAGVARFGAEPLRSLEAMRQATRQ